MSEVRDDSSVDLILDNRVAVAMPKALDCGSSAASWLWRGCSAKGLQIPSP